MVDAQIEDGVQIWHLVSWISNMWCILSKWDASLQILNGDAAGKTCGGDFFVSLRFLLNQKRVCVLYVLWKFWSQIRSLNDVILVISGLIGNWPNYKPKFWKPISPYHTFQYHNGQMGIPSLRIVQFNKINDLYKMGECILWYYSKTKFWPCAQKKNLILSIGHICLVTYGSHMSCAE